MKKFLIAAALTLSSLGLMAAPNLPACSITADVESDALACFSMPGNDNGVGSFVAQAALAHKFGVGDGPLGDNPWTKTQSFGSGGNSGTLTFSSAVPYLFAVTLKAGNGYNAYLFDGGLDGISSVDYSINKSLSHANLWTFTGQSDTYGCGGVCAPIPEPQTYAMMLAGLAGLGFVAWRRKTV